MYPGRVLQVGASSQAESIRYVHTQVHTQSPSGSATILAKSFRWVNYPGRVFQGGASVQVCLDIPQSNI
jgi:hypothetical protein